MLLFRERCVHSSMKVGDPGLQSALFVKVCACVCVYADNDRNIYSRDKKQGMIVHACDPSMQVA